MIGYHERICTHITVMTVMTFYIVIPQNQIIYSTCFKGIVAEPTVRRANEVTDIGTTNPARTASKSPFRDLGAGQAERSWESDL